MSRFTPIALLVLAVCLAPIGSLAAAAQEIADEAGTERTEGRGTIAGRVTDGASGAPLEGVEVELVVPDAATGAVQVRGTRRSGDDGVFGFESLEAGRYALRFSKEGHRESLVTDVVVEAGAERRVDLPLPVRVAASDEPTQASPEPDSGAGGGPEPTQLEEFIVTAEKLEDMVSVRIDSDQLLNVVGTEDFSKFAAGDVGEVLERVAGVNVVEGQFAIIRGLEDRYSSTTLNGAPVPSPDPDSQSVQLDLFPSEVVGNLAVAKSFSSEQPSNSSGGAINVVTHEYPDDVELTLKVGTGWNENAQDEFIEAQGHVDVDRVVNGFGPIGTENGAPVYPDLEAWRENGFRFVDANPVGLRSDKEGSFFEKLDDVLESDYVATFGGKRVFGDREFRLKAVLSQETDYETSSGFEESRQPSLPIRGPSSFEFDPVTFELITIPGAVEKAGGLANGVLGLSEGRYDLTISEKVQQVTGFTGFGFDLDEEGNHKVDASFLYTQVDTDTVELQENGTLPGFDYEAYFRGQLVEEAPTDALASVASNYISEEFRSNGLFSPTTGALAIANFGRSTTFETDRDLWVAQVNGDHRFELLEGLHFSWAYNQARTTQDESAIGTPWFFEPCGFSALVPCPAGTERLDPDQISYPPTLAELGPGRYVVRRDQLLSANGIRENADFYRIDADYELDLSEAARFQIAGGLWAESADREVRSAFLQSPLVTPDVNENCSGTAASYACLGKTPLALGATAFDALAFDDGNLAGIQETSSDASRSIDAWHLRGKLSLFDTIDLLGGFRREKIVIQSLNDPFERDPVTGEPIEVLGGPLTFPNRYLYLDRLDNPFTQEVGVGTIENRGPAFVFNDQLLGVPLTAGPCRGDDGSIPGITCIDFSDEDSLQSFFDGRIDEELLLPSAGLTIRPFEGLILRGAWSRTVARPSFRELGYYVTVEPGTNDLIVGNPQLQLSRVESYDARAEYTWGARGDLVALSYFTKKIENPIEALLLADPLQLPSVVSYQTFFNNPATADLSGIEAEARVSFGFFEDIDAIADWSPDWLEYLSIGGNYTYIKAEVPRTATDVAATQTFYAVPEGETALFQSLPPTRRLFNQPEWIANADISFDHPDSGLRATLAYFAISDVLDAAGSATVNPETGLTFAYVPDRYVGAYMDLRATLSKTFVLPGSFGEMTLSATAKNLTNSSRKLIYDSTQTNKEIAEQELRLGRDYSFAITFRRRF